MLYKQFDKIFAGGNILAALYAYVVMKNIIPLKYRVSVNIYILILVVQLFYA